MLTSNKEAAQIAESLNLIQVSEESDLIQFIEQVISENTSEAERFKRGEQQLICFFMGQLMKVSKGKADPKIANTLLRQKLNEA